MMLVSRLLQFGAVESFAGAITGLGAVVLVLRLPALAFDQLPLFLALLAAAIVISVSKVRLPIAGGTAQLSMWFGTDLLSLMLLGADQAMLIAGVSAVLQCCFMSRTWPTRHRVLFSAAVPILAVQAAGLAAGALGGFHRDLSPARLVVVTLAAAVALYVVNITLVGLAVAWSQGQSMARAWLGGRLRAAPALLIAAACALVLAIIPGTSLWAVLLTAGPLYAISSAYRQSSTNAVEHQRNPEDISALHLATVEALALAIDARDQTIEGVRGGNHLHRVQTWAVALAEAAGVPPADREGVRVAALLHDVGKLAVPEHILTKPGQLTAAEFARIRIHPIVGAEIVKAVPFPYPVAPIVKCHHERWDGTGYPEGLRGSDIPLGARVLAVVDCYDALRSPRTFRAAAGRLEAIEILQSEAGRGLDPALVATFLTLLPALEAMDVEPRPTKILSPPKGKPRSGTAAEPSPLTPDWVFHMISMATHEMRTLNEVSQTLGTRLTVEDTMALLSSKLGRLIPGSCWALFLYEPEGDALRCRYATGTNAASLDQMRIPAGDGLTGWVARNRVAVLNACADADFASARVAMVEPRFRSALATALVDGTQLIGTLTIYHLDPQPFCDEHRQLLEHMSGQIASVIGTAVAFERMRDQSYTDPLTGLPNSRALGEFLAKGALDKRAQHAFVMIDVDDFKAINDRHGHAAGDAALQALAATMQGFVRDSDFCARYGGDEFVVVLSMCDRQTGEERATGLQQAIAGLQFATAHGPLRLGASVGVSLFPDDGATPKELIAAADARMYSQKRRKKSSRRVISA
jgi:diguanylate cyclase (GGDEF)-like protein/putative nucleotidyltransferase with HDIG domain